MSSSVSLSPWESERFALVRQSVWVLLLCRCFVFLPELAAIAADEEQQDELRQIFVCLFVCFFFFLGLPLWLALLQLEQYVDSATKPDSNDCLLVVARSCSSMQEGRRRQ
jgi:hypothetical protein